MNHASEDPQSRAWRIAEIRRQIAAGTYETPGRLAQAVEKFLEREAAAAEAKKKPRP